MYVSTAYSNAHLEKNSTVKEQLYPLKEPDGKEVDHAAIVERLLALPVEEAQARYVCPGREGVGLGLGLGWGGVGLGWVGLGWVGSGRVRLGFQPCFSCQCLYS